MIAHTNYAIHIRTIVEKKSLLESSSVIPVKGISKQIAKKYSHHNQHLLRQIVCTSLIFNLRDCEEEQLQIRRLIKCLEKKAHKINFLTIAT